MSLLTTFVQRPVTVSVGVILVVLFGLLSLFGMPMQLTPDVEIPTLKVETRWSGASPQEIEKEIVQPQEEQLQSVEGIVKMTSESMDSMARITLEFAVGADMRKALLLVNTRLQQVREYPIDADEPVITSNASEQFIAWFILHERTPTPDEFAKALADCPQLAESIRHVQATQNPGLQLFRLKELVREHSQLGALLPVENDLTTYRRFAEDFIEARFERVEGVSNSNVVGGREEQMEVIVDPQRLSARRLTIGDVRDALRAQNKDTSGGDLWEGKRRYVIRTLGQLRSPEQVENAIVARRDDAAVYVRDIAEVKLGYKKPDGLVRRYGSQVIAINCQRETGANVLRVMEGLSEATRQLNAQVLAPRGLQLTQVYDETEYIHSSVGLVNQNIYEGGILTFIVLMLFLRSLRSTLIVFVSIAVSVVGMFLILGLLGRSLNVLSLAGIAFAVGMLVDNFIVVLENIHRYHSEGESSLDATVKGTKDVWGAIICSTLANLAVFVPVLFVQDQAGQLFRDIALATSAALVMSLLAALVIVPTATSRMLRHQHSGASRWALVRLLAALIHPLLVVCDRLGGAFVQLVVGINAFVQRSVLLKLLTVAIFVVGAAALSWLMMPKVEYLPRGNRNLAICMLLPPPGYNIDQMQKMGAQIEANLRPYWDVDAGSEAAQQLDFPVIGDFFYVARGRQLFMGVRTNDPLEAGKIIPLLRRAASDMPGTFGIAFQASLFESALAGGRKIDVEITGPDIERLVQLGGQIIGQTAGLIPGAQLRPVPSLDLSSPEMHIVPKWDQAADMGVSAAELGYTIDALVDGAYATDYFIGGDKIDLAIVGHRDFVAKTQDLGALPITTPKGDLITLSAVADLQLRSGMEQINHRERQRAITIEVTPPDAIPLSAAMDLIREQIVEPLEHSGALDGGLYQVSLAGTADKLRSTWHALRWNLLLAIVITYLVIAALFESWLYPFVIMLSVPLGAVGGLLGLQLLNLWVLQPLDVLTMLGFIILVGTVVNNPILIVEQALVNVREQNMHPRDAVLDSVRTRIRPIFMTAFIGLFGLLPLVISPGAGSELYRGLGSVMLGGLVVSTLFTLVLVPTLFSLTLSAKEWLFGREELESLDERGDEMPRLVMRAAADDEPLAPTAAS